MKFWLKNLIFSVYGLKAWRDGPSLKQNYINHCVQFHCALFHLPVTKTIFFHNVGYHQRCTEILPKYTQIKGTVRLKTIENQIINQQTQVNILHMFLNFHANGIPGNLPSRHPCISMHQHFSISCKTVIYKSFYLRKNTKERYHLVCIWFKQDQFYSLNPPFVGDTGY